MIDQLISLVKSQATEYFIQDPDIPNEYAEQAANATGESIIEVIQNQVMSGNMGVLQQLMGVGSSQQSNNAANGDLLSTIIQQASVLLSGKLQTQVGVSANTASNAAGGIIPAIIGTILDKFRSTAPQDAGFDIGSIINLVLGGGLGNNSNNQSTNNSVEDNNPLGGLNDLLGGNMGSILGNILGGGK